MERSERDVDPAGLIDFAQAELAALEEALTRVLYDVSKSEGESRENWVETTLGEICEINPRKPRARELPGEMLVSFVPMAALDAELGAIVAAEMRPVTEVRQGFRAFREGDVLMARISPSMENGKAAVAEDLVNRQGFGTTEFHVLRPLADIPPKLILAFLRRRAFREEAAAQMTGGTGRRRVPASFLAAHPFALPSPSEQQQIVARIEAISAELQKARTRARRTLDTIEDCRAAILAAGCLGRLTGESPAAEAPPRFGDVEALPQLPGGWAWSSIGAAAKRLQYGTSTRSDADSSTGVPYVGMGNLRRGKLVTDDRRYVELPPDAIRKFRLEPGDVLFNRTNSPALVGKAALVEEGVGEVVFASYLIRIQVDRAVAIPAFVSHWINSPWGREWAGRVKSDSIGQSNINGRKLGAMPMPLPPLAAQAAACERIEELLGRCDELERQAEGQSGRVETLGDVLLERAFEGGLVEARMGDAAVEATRIQVARARLAQGKELEAPQLPPAEAPRDRQPPAGSPHEQLTARIAEMKADSFGFEELRRGLEIGYEELVSLLFSLLRDSGSGLSQGFDPDAGEMRLRRASR